MKKALISLYLLEGRLYAYRGYVQLAIGMLILICILLAFVQIELLHSHLHLSYGSIADSSSEPIGGGH
jgi:hypothetical protein